MGTLDALSLTSAFGVCEQVAPWCEYGVYRPYRASMLRAGMYNDMLLRGVVRRGRPPSRSRPPTAAAPPLRPRSAPWLSLFFWDAMLLTALTGLSQRASREARGPNRSGRLPPAQPKQAPHLRMSRTELAQCAQIFVTDARMRL